MSCSRVSSRHDATGLGFGVGKGAKEKGSTKHEVVGKGDIGIEGEKNAAVAESELPYGSRCRQRILCD